MSSHGGRVLGQLVPWVLVQECHDRHVAEKRTKSMMSSLWMIKSRISAFNSAQMEAEFPSGILDLAYFRRMILN